MTEKIMHITTDGFKANTVKYGDRHTLMHYTINLGDAGVKSMMINHTTDNPVCHFQNDLGEVEITFNENGDEVMRQSKMARPQIKPSEIEDDFGINAKTTLGAMHKNFDAVIKEVMNTRYPTVRTS